MGDADENTVTDVVGPNDSRQMKNIIAKYRALIFIPIVAKSDDEAYEIACRYAASLSDKVPPPWTGRTCIIGHVELVWESESRRVAISDLPGALLPKPLPVGYV
jgi:hypothetical protein